MCFSEIFLNDLLLLTCLWFILFFRRLCMVIDSMMCVYFYFLTLSNYNCRIHCKVRFCCHYFGCPICCCLVSELISFPLSPNGWTATYDVENSLLFMCHRNGIKPTMLRSLSSAGTFCRWAKTQLFYSIYFFVWRFVFEKRKQYSH